MKIALFSPALPTLVETVNSPYEDWFNQGKADAWAGIPKSSPDHDPQAASFYDLGYDEGVIQKSPL
jgi:hypothetical protein